MLMIVNAHVNYLKVVCVGCFLFFSPSEGVGMVLGSINGHHDTQKYYPIWSRFSTGVRNGGFSFRLSSYLDVTGVHATPSFY
jgi:hypothetical protein